MINTNKKTRIILASASPRRRELLAQVGITPEVMPSHVEEVVTSTEPDQVVMELSAQKAEKALIHMCVYTHGYASMLAGGQMKSTLEHIAEYICAAHRYLLVALNRDAD